MSDGQTWGREAAVGKVKSDEVAALRVIVGFCLFATVIVLAFAIFMRSSIVSKYLEPVEKTVSGIVSDAVYGTAPFKFDEKPFVHLRRRHRHSDGKRGSTDDWVMYGVARYGAPSFYIGFWNSQRGSSVRFEAKHRLKKYNTLADWGEIEPDFQSKFVETKVGKFEFLPFKYRPPSGEQHCIYYSSVDLPKSIYLRGHYCSIEAAGLGEKSLRRTLSTIEHPALSSSLVDKPEKVELSAATSKRIKDTKKPKPSNRRTEYLVNESVPVATDVGYGAAISYAISTKTFSRLPKVTWASVGSKKWGRGEWLFYGREDETRPWIGMGITHKRRGNSYKVSLQRSIKRMKYFKKKPVEFTGRTVELDTQTGLFHIGFFETVIKDVDKTCIGFLAKEINPAMFIRGYYCGGGTELPEVSILKDILNSLQSRRYGFNAP